MSWLEVAPLGCADENGADQKARERRNTVGERRPLTRTRQIRRGSQPAGAWRRLVRCKQASPTSAISGRPSRAEQPEEGRGAGR